MDKPAFEVDQLTVNYEKTPVLWDVSFSLPSGILAALVGPNGAGKTTLLKASLGLLRPISGSVLAFGSPLLKVRKSVAYIPQRESVDWDFPITVFDLVLMGSYARMGLLRWPSKKERKRVWETLEQVEMADLAERQINQLSGGQQGRAFLARALMQKANLYLMDEPFAGIDMASSQVILELLRSLQKEGKTILVVHHDLATVRATFDWTILLNMRLIACGKTSEVLTQENIASTYGKENLLLDEVAKRTQEKIEGYPTLNS